jgi:predicted DNA-binding transcriptional regulator AlpA
MGSKMKLRSNKEAADRLGISESTLNHGRVSGQGPQFVKLGRRVMYRDEDLDAFIAKNLRQSTSETQAA